MNHWITVHWPQRVGEALRKDVFLQDGHREAGEHLAPGDLVFLYETAGAPDSFRKTPDGPVRTPIIEQGRQGIIGIVRLTTALHERPDHPHSELSDGRKMWWRWMADGEIVSTQGFVPRADVNEILGHKRAWNWRGFGDRRSGLRRISAEEYQAILAKFEARDHSD